jgi:hypothetical protein
LGIHAERPNVRSSFAPGCAAHSGDHASPGAGRSRAMAQ